MLVTQTPAPDPLPPMPPMPVDPNFLVSQIMPLIGGIAAMVVVALVARWFFHAPIGEAFAEGIRVRRRRRWGITGDSGGDEPRVAALEDQVRLLSTQLSELGERLDFTERMLAGGRTRRLGAGE
jgi:hypothetical protein